MATLPLEREIATQFLSFINKSRSAFFAVAAAKEQLVANGYKQLSERERFNIAPGGKYFFTRNQSSIVAFAVGKKYDGATSAFNIVAAHTDSPCLKLKPITKVEKCEYLQVGVQTYGGGLWHTWFDRDLGLSGRVIVKEGNNFVSRLVQITKPILRIPTLAIHLDRSVDEGFKFNKEEQLLPILASSLKSPENTKDADHHRVLLEIIASDLQVKVEDIESLDLSLCDCQDSVLGGAKEEFIFSGRLDNLMMSYTGLHSLIESSTDEHLANQPNILLLALFDNEEVGSQSAYGADSALLPDTIAKISSALPNPDIVSTVIRRSVMLSCDMAHGCHPNYAGKHESNHKPLIHGGPVIKYNANQRYATTNETSFIITELGKRHNIPVQHFVVRNDSPCGSTIGPILAAKLGMRCVDLGIPQFSMHSIREMAGTADLVHTTRLLKHFFIEYADLDKHVFIDEEPPK
eukprot:TRINITY_DN6608_c0_g3_i2.p1 TRINITY_DN6608_c0_g3~~TRINITY_DN6608_c0_g3_i2.p1  ORF type:complete len:462 (+),score=119.25 TRINITY_DN6608_c0_g3_i2:234-1619(+)